MISEREVRSRYQAYEAELRQLDQEIYTLKMRVRMGSENWRLDVDRLAERAERRRALDAQWQALKWVLVADASESELHAYG